METIVYENVRKLPVVKTADVIVVGGGPAGIGAAVLAAKSGCSTLLIERYGMLGGMASVGEVHPFMPNHCSGESLDAPVYQDWLNQMKFYMPDDIVQEMDAEQDYTCWLSRSINKEIAALAAEDLLKQAGVELLYHHSLADVKVKERNIEALILNSKSGFSAVKGKNYVDCSGDGDLAAMAGCRFESGDTAGNCQPMTLCFKLSHVKAKHRKLPNGYKGFDPEWRKIIQLKYKEAQQTGLLSCPRENILMFPFYLEDDEVVHFNSTRILGHDATNGVSLSEAEQIGRQQLREYLFWLRQHVPGFEKCRLRSMAVNIGIRESRRIMGRAYLTRENFKKRSKFPDAVARCNYCIDIHSPLGAGTEIEDLPQSDYYEIPYGCIVPADIDNLTVGGRPISVDVAIHSSMRVMPMACSVGQAAGIAAALAVKEKTHPPELDGCKVRKALINAGAKLQVA
jgi:hypothetical protein